MTKRFAFTLAEVLIALAIIGVVAAMTIPTFMANTAGAQFRTGFKKGITVLTQAASANYATEGYDFGGTNVAYGTTTEATPTNNKVLNSVIGFNTASNATATAPDLDMTQDVQSLFHLFQGNLNMKNSNEIANYEVGIPDVALHCEGTNTMQITINGTDKNVTGLKSNGLTSRATANPPAANADPDAIKLQTKGGISNLCDGRTLGESGVGGINQGRMFMLEDGMVFTYDAGQASCTENNPCFGYLDVNGPAGPNKIISCSDGTKNQNAYIRSYGSNMQDKAAVEAQGNDPAQPAVGDGSLLSASCTVDAKDITDIFPVLFYDSTVKPASLAAKAVLYSQKSNQK